MKQAVGRLEAKEKKDDCVISSEEDDGGVKAQQRIDKKEKIGEAKYRETEDEATEIQQQPRRKVEREILKEMGFKEEEIQKVEAKSGKQLEAEDIVEEILADQGQIRRLTVFIQSEEPQKETLQGCHRRQGLPPGLVSSAQVAAKLVDSIQGAVAAVGSDYLPQTEKNKNANNYQHETCPRPIGPDTHSKGRGGEMGGAMEKRIRRQTNEFGCPGAEHAKQQQKALHCQGK